METEIREIEFKNEFRVCPECGYTDGFHTMLKKEKNDFKFTLCKSELILYADDTTIYTRNKDLNKANDEIEIELNNLIDWFRSNKLY